MTKVIIKTIAIIVALGFVAGVYFYSQFHPAKQVQFGLIFSADKAKALGLDPKEVYDNMMTDLKPGKVLMDGQGRTSAKLLPLNPVFYSSMFGYYKLPLPAAVYRIYAGFTRKSYAGTLDMVTPKEIFTVKAFQENVRYAQKVGLSENYLSGVEWWYYLTQKKSDFSLWHSAKDLLTQ